MSSTAVFLKIDPERIADCLLEACANVDSASETVLDFSSVRRIDPSALRAMERLAGLADHKGLKVGLFGVNVEIYKVLKLAKLAPRFCFLTREYGRSHRKEEEGCHAEPSQR
jgi:anti-anti-sigma regulatory factor